LLLGNKTDLKDNRKVSEEMGAQLAKENNYIFKESSCKDNYNVSSAFETLIEMTNFELKNNNLRQKKIDIGKLTSTLNNDSKIKKNNCC
jgi:GTPase SAR1 family protein